MKRDLLWIFICMSLHFILPESACCQAPNKMSYQAVIRNASNGLVTNQNVGMRISILQNTAVGTPVYVETQTILTNANGLASLQIGSGTVVSGNFSTINWSSGLYFIKTETDPAGGTNYTISSTTQLVSVPYAMYASTSGSSTPGPAGPQGPIGLTGATGSQGPAGFLTSGTASGNTPYWNGTTWSVNSNNIYNNGSNIGIGTNMPGYKLDVIGNGRYTGSLRIGNYTLPSSDGSAGQLLKTNGSGVLNWSNDSGSYTGGNGININGNTINSVWSYSGMDIYNNNTGNIGINNAVPVSKFQVSNGAVLFDGIAGNTPVSGGGTRMMWIPSKSAFRAGGVLSGEWDDNNIGYYSSALGENNIASGYGSMAAGSYAEASGVYSVAMGASPKASGYSSTAFGFDAEASGDFSTAIGYRASTNNKLGAFIITDAAGNGYPLFASSNNEFTSRYTGGYRFFSDNDVTEGKGLFLKSGNIGIGDSTPTASLEIRKDYNAGTDAFRISYTDPTLYYLGIQPYVFAGGNVGYKFITNNNTTAVTAFVLTGNGAMGISTESPTANLSVNGSANKPGGGSWAVFSDRRFKKDISPYHDGLSMLSKISPVKYHYNELSGCDTKPEYVGVIAQDLQEIAPYMVSTIQKDSTDYLQVDNSAMTYMLINAVKEQQEQIEALKKQNKEQQEQNHELLNRLEALEKK